ncbi:type IV toxin-antitoxin system AbiEi family antitoxin domain-containing protein [Nocardia sp. NPDC060256]|uniref:type IV toxin-antitoxin system AbiEi family antitoxin domain-containing protein n=1 Tax=unclassified Nocardia TaxID=2637762 RepID=UPI003655BE71
MRSDERLLGLAELAESQWGLFTTAQAGAAGINPQRVKRLADSALIVRLRQGVYRLAGLPEAPEESIRAEWLALEPKRLAGDRVGDPVPMGVVSHRSAARLLELGDLDADFHEFIVPRRRSTRSPDVRFHIETLGREDWELSAGLPVTRPLRTVVDLAAAHIDGGHLAAIARDAIYAGGTTISELAIALRPYAHHYGAAIGAGTALVELFIAQAGVPRSALDLAWAARHRRNTAAHGSDLRTPSSADSMIDHPWAPSSPEVRTRLRDFDQTLEKINATLGSPEFQSKLQAMERALEMINGESEPSADDSQQAGEEL